jgi:hypothetical protein
MHIPLHIETHDRTLGFEIAAADNTLRSGAAVSAPGGATLEYTGTFVCKSVGIPEVLQFVIDASINIDLGLFAAWLYDKVKGKQVERIIINRRVITTITTETIRQVLEEEIRSRE